MNRNRAALSPGFAENYPQTAHNRFSMFFKTSPAQADASVMKIAP
jgi:hypothetical protein